MEADLLLASRPLQSRVSGSKGLTEVRRGGEGEEEGGCEGKGEGGRGKMKEGGSVMDLSRNKPTAWRQVCLLNADTTLHIVSIHESQLLNVEQNTEYDVEETQ